MAETTLAVVRDPWGRLPREGVEAFHAFGHYRDMPVAERSIDAAYRVHVDTCLKDRKRAARGPLSGKWNDWCTRYGWVERVAAWEDSLDKAKRDAQVAEVVEMGKRHAAQAMASLEALAAPAMAAVKAMEAHPELIEELAEASGSPGMFLGLLDFVKQASASLPGLAKMEREARGVQDEVAGPGEQQVKVVVRFEEDWRS